MEIVLFDVGNVIIKGNFDLTYRKLEGYGVSRQNAERFYDNEDYHDFSRGKITALQFYDALANNHLQCPSLTYQQVVDAHDAQIYALDEDVVRIISELVSQRKDIAIITDTNEWQTRVEKELVDLTKLGIPSERIFRSHEIGMLKTDEECFPYVLKQLGVDYPDVYLVDDRHEKIEMAQKHGLRTIKFTDSESLVTDLVARGLME